MYHAHFGLQQSPFGITPNPAFFYTGNTRGAILDALLYAVTHGEGIVKVTGEVGSGKTMLCRMLESVLPPHIEVIYLVNPSLSPDEVLFTIAGELNIAIAGKRSDEVLRLLHSDLIDKHAAGKQVLLLVEEAQAMPLATLEEIRLLTNLETAYHKLLQIVLFGQPELDVNLNLPEMRQLKERITHSFTVPPMAPELIPDFLAFRLGAAGYRGPPLFDAGAVRKIAGVSRGIVRRINILADKALLAAFADDAKVVAARHVKQAIRDSAFGPPPADRRRDAMLAAAVLAVAGLAAAAMAWFVLSPPNPRQSARVAVAASAVAPLPVALPAVAEKPVPPAAAGAALTAGAAPAKLEADVLLRQCLEDSKTWLRTQPEQQLVLQIMAIPAARPAALEAFLRNTREAIGLQQVHAYPLTLDGTPSIAIVYGSFATRKQAEQVQALLSEQGLYRPQIRAIQTMREEARRSGGADLW
ncbi:MSHA biogenesis protein MshM [Oxalobacteraceae bacterium GrIS 1.11]